MVLANVSQRSDQRQAGLFTPTGGKLVLVFVPFEQRLDDLVAGLDGQRASIDHVLAHQLGDLLQPGRFHVQHYGPVQQQRSQLKQRVQRQGGHVRLGPPIAALLDVLLELDPPGGLLPGHLVALLD